MIDRTPCSALIHNGNYTIIGPMLECKNGFFANSSCHGVGAMKRWEQPCMQMEVVGRQYGWNGGKPPVLVLRDNQND